MKLFKLSKRKNVIISQDTNVKNIPVSINLSCKNKKKFMQIIGQLPSKI